MFAGKNTPHFHAVYGIIAHKQTIMQDIQTEMRNRAKELLESKQAGLVVGFTLDEYGKPTPAFITDPDDVGRLVWNDDCVRSRHNLVGCLKRDEVRKLGKPAVVVNAAGKRAFNVLIAESQQEPGDVVLIDMEPEPRDARFDERYAKLAMLDTMSREERFAFWKKEFTRCFKCYACRQVCPLCYCTQCIVDKNRPQRIDTSATLKGNFAWNITRAFHLAGRCVGCGACSAACPAGIDLDLLNLSLARAGETHFDGYRAGENPDTLPIIGTFSVEDKETFIR